MGSMVLTVTLKVSGQVVSVEVIVVNVSKSSRSKQTSENLNKKSWYKVLKFNLSSSWPNTNLNYNATFKDIIVEKAMGRNTSYLAGIFKID